ncbi:hypothetical protein MNBD_ACTINO02-3306, partial [hydrothermal vent metagenome]
MDSTTGLKEGRDVTATVPDTLLEVEDLHKAYGDVVALN